MSGPGPLEGLLAINKPTGISSAQALRDLQRVFRTSPIFHETLETERRRRQDESGRQKQKRRAKRGPVDVKIGHGGTLDPMATGVLIAGIGGATKHLQQFLSCKKSYECIALFGCSTDTYDAMGKVMRRASYKHITKEAVEETLNAFRGDILQKPPIYSALHHEGKRYYEYAREGIPLPVEIKSRPVTVDSIELLDFTTDHPWTYPEEELSDEDKLVGKVLLGQPSEAGDDAGKMGDKKHARNDEADPEAAEPAAKKIKPGAAGGGTAPVVEKNAGTPTDATPTIVGDTKPAAVTIRMTVTSGFYVRSFVQDLGEALGSAAHMVKLVRTRQGQFELGKNVFEWKDVMNPDTSFWEERVEKTLRAWSAEQPSGNGSSSKEEEWGSASNETSRE